MKGIVYNVGDRYVNKPLQTNINSSLHTVPRCTEEGTLAIKVSCVMGMVYPGRSNLRSLNRLTEVCRVCKQGQ